MDGVHDMGGMDGFGKVEPEANVPMFHADWEARVLAMVRAIVRIHLCAVKFHGSRQCHHAVLHRTLNIFEALVVQRLRHIRLDLCIVWPRTNTTGRALRHANR